MIFLIIKEIGNKDITLVNLDNVSFIDLRYGYVDDNDREYKHVTRLNLVEGNYDELVTLEPIEMLYKRIQKEAKAK